MGNANKLLGLGVTAAFVLLIAAVWASDAGTATSLAMTGVLVLIGVGVLAAALHAGDPPADAGDDQRRRMRDSIP